MQGSLLAPPASGSGGGGPAGVELWEHQTQALRAIDEAYERGVTAQLISMATGAGKTVTFVHLLRILLAERGYRQAVIIVHRDELVDQTVDKLHAHAPQLTVGIVKAERNELGQDVTVASAQTLAHGKRLDALVRSLRRPCVLVVDEAHHAAADTWQHAVEAIGAELTTGWTATAYRADQRALGKLFTEVTYHIGMLPLIALGLLADLQGLRIDTASDLDGVHTRAGEFVERELSQAIDTPERNQLIVDAWHEHAHAKGRRRPVGFCVNVAHAEHLKATFRANGVPAELVTGETEPAERRRIYRLFKEDGMEGAPLLNVMVLCLDNETEILTTDGWVSPAFMTDRHQVAQWDDGLITFVEPEEIVRRPRGPRERMATIEAKQTSVRVTEGHWMLHRSPDSRTWHKSQARDLIDQRIQIPVAGSAAPFILDAEPIPTRTAQERARLISRTAYNLRTREGYGKPADRTEAVRRVDRRAALRHKAPGALSLDECRLIGFWIGDGSVTKLQSGGMEYTLSQAVAYPTIAQWVDDLLVRCNLDHQRRYYAAPRNGTGGPSYRWSLPRGTGGGTQERNGLFSIEPYLDKQGSPLLWGLHQDQFQAFMDGLWHADGNHGQATCEPATYSISGSNYQLLSLIQAIAACRNCKTNLQPERRERANPNHAQVYRLAYQFGHTAVTLATPDTTMKLDDVERDEEVWCVKVPAHNIVTRRHGTVTIMGNTEGWDEPRADCALMTRPTKSLGLYVQQVGRVARWWPDKRDALVLDFVDGSSQHKLIGLPTLAGHEAEGADDGDTERDMEDRRLDGEQLSLLDLATKIGTVRKHRAEAVDLFGRSPHIWSQAAGRWMASAPIGEKGARDPYSRYLTLWPEGDGFVPARLIVPPAGTGALPTVERLFERPMDVQAAISLAEALVPNSPLTNREAEWRKTPASEAQLNFARRLGVELPRDPRKGEVSEGIDRVLFERAVRRLEGNQRKGGKR